MKRLIAVSIFGLVVSLCSSRGTDLFDITANEQLAKFQELFRSLVSQDNKSLSKMIAYFALGNDPDGADQVALYERDNFVAFLNATWSNYDHISVMVDEESLRTKTEFRDGKSIRSNGFDHGETVRYKPYIVADSEIIYECSMMQKNTGARLKARIKVSMDNIYTDDYPDGIITYLYFTNLGEQNGDMSPVSE
jgi:hypothetical protein